MGSKTKYKDHMISLQNYMDTINKGDVSGDYDNQQSVALRNHDDVSPLKFSEVINTTHILAEYKNIKLTGDTGAKKSICLSNDMYLGKMYALTFVSDQPLGISAGATRYVVDKDLTYYVVRLATDTYKVFEMVEATPAV